MGAVRERAVGAALGGVRAVRVHGKGFIVAPCDVVGVWGCVLSSCEPRLETALFGAQLLAGGRTLPEPFLWLAAVSAIRLLAYCVVVSRSTVHFYR